MSILITGGAGYIGSHVVKHLLENTNENIVVVDNFSTGNMNTINELQKIRNFIFYKEDLCNEKNIEKILEKYEVKSIIHFAAFSVVSESVRDPLKYYLNNTVNTIKLLNLVDKLGIEKFIFSSTAAVYGEVDETQIPIKESTLTKPINPYGYSKLMSEQAIIDFAKNSKKFKFVIFRYFNVAGADMYFHKENLQPRIGECHEPETHLIPLVVQTALGKRPKIDIYGDDFSTKDGTCIRDYIHVEDLAELHVKALNYLEKNQSQIFNAGYNMGYSVKEIITKIKEISNNDFTVNISKRREGDPAILVANTDNLINEMNWKPKYNSTSTICESALVWEKLK